MKRLLLPVVSLLALPAVVAAESAPGATQDISADEIRALIRQLKDMRAGVDAEERKSVEAARAALTAAVAGNSESLSLYTASMKLLDSERKNRRPGDFEGWKKANEEKLHDASFATALRYQYRYLKLALDAYPDRGDRVSPAAMVLLGEAIRDLPKCDKYADVMKEDVFSSPVARRFGIEKRCPEGWPKSLLDVEGHFRRFIQAAVKTDPSKLQGLWDQRITLERALASARDQANRPPVVTSGVFGKKAPDPRQDAGRNAETFETERLPRLMWSMGEDLHKAGLRRRGFETMFVVLKRYPKHAAYQEWLDRISELAEELAPGEETPPATKPGESPVPAPVAPAEGEIAVK